jgi:hypothetical protein
MPTQHERVKVKAKAKAKVRIRQESIKNLE